MSYKKIKVQSYKCSTKSKKEYLARKKSINRYLKYLKKTYKNSKCKKRRIYLEKIEAWEITLHMLNAMYKYYKRKNKK